MTAEEQDAAATAYAEKVLALVDRWHAETTQAGIPGAEPGSALAGDDAGLRYLQLSHMAWQSHVTAVDHLRGVRVLMTSGQPIDGHAPHTLIRSALENAAAVCWLLAPTSRAERRSRSLRMAWTDAYESGRVQDLIGVVPAPPGEPANVRKDEIRQLAAELSLDVGAVCRTMRYREVVRVAAAAVDLDPDAVEVLWRALSGFAHGRRWASLALLERVVTNTTGKVHTVALTASTPGLAAYITTAGAFVGTGRDLYERRRRSYM